MGYSTDTFFDIMYDRLKAEPLSRHASAEAFLAECGERRGRLREILALDKLEAPGCGIRTEQLSETEYRIEALPGSAFPVWVLKPSVRGVGTVLYVPGHDAYGARGSFNDYGQQDPFHHWLPLELVKNGYTVVMPELIGFGEMVKRRFNDDYKGCYANTEVAQLMGLSIEGIRVYQVLCTMEVMRTVMGLSADLLYGISGGGLVTALTCALSGGVRAAVISNYGASFRSSIMSIRHCVDNYIPSLLEIGECADLIALGAPRPLLLTNGTADRIFPCEGVRETADELSRIYSLLGAEDSFRCHFHSGGHEAAVRETIDFFNSCTG